jgi:hypothetical protein
MTTGRSHKRGDTRRIDLERWILEGEAAEEDAVHAKRRREIEQAYREREFDEWILTEGRNA